MVEAVAAGMDVELAVVKARRADEQAWEVYDQLLVAASSRPSSSPFAAGSSS